MPDSAKTVIIAAISSDIGLAMADRWLNYGWRIFGTYRQHSPRLAALEKRDAVLVPCDFSHKDSVREAASRLLGLVAGWDVLVLGAGAMEPIGPFRECVFDAWTGSVEANFVNPLRLLHELLPAHRKGAPLEPLVLMFAGGGANSAPVNYSAYTVSKIALTKMCELLDAEQPDLRHVIIGPGWVRTKIHEETLRAGARAGSALEATQRRLAEENFTPMQEVLDCCDWVVSAPRSVIGGRNISVAFDRWGSRELDNLLASDPEIYKLRRAGNARLQRSKS